MQNTTEESALSAHGIIGKIGTETLTFTQKVANRMRSLTPKECEQMINEYNPELRHYQKVSAADGMKFDINQHRSKAGNLTKVSIRETNGFCLKKKSERE